MESSMSPKLQKTFKNTWAYEINQQLKEMFQAKASKERLNVVKSIMACKPKPRASIYAFVLEMKGYFDGLESLNMVSCVDCWSQCKERKTSHSNWKGKAAKGESDHRSKRKAESEIAPISDPKEAACFYCNTKGHWKRSCPKYLKDLKDGKVKKGSLSSMFRIELHNTTTSDSWVLDTSDDVRDLAMTSKRSCHKETVEDS
ncbi:retrotransposon protein, putative, ty1-copia subclass [Tanacetum coccineum]